VDYRKVVLEITAQVFGSPLGRASSAALGSGLVLGIADVYPPQRFRIALLGGLAVGLLTLWFWRDAKRVVLYALIATVFAWAALLVSTIATIILRIRGGSLTMQSTSASAQEAIFKVIPPDVAASASFGTLGITILLGVMYLVLDARDRLSQQVGPGGGK